MRVHRYSKTKTTQETEQKTGKNPHEGPAFGLLETSAGNTRVSTRTAQQSKSDTRQTQINKKQTGQPAQTNTQQTESKKRSAVRTPRRACSAVLRSKQKQTPTGRAHGRAFSAMLTYAKTGGPCSAKTRPRLANSAKQKTKVEISVQNKTSSSPDVDRILPRVNSVKIPLSKKLPPPL
jgi:hypothetical protein